MAENESIGRNKQSAISSISDPTPEGAAMPGTGAAPGLPRFIEKCGMAKWMVVDTLNTDRVIAECARFDDAAWIAESLNMPVRRAASASPHGVEYNGALTGAEGVPCSASDVAQPPRDVSELYHELLYAVARKFPGESRHETALRYIRQREKRAGETLSENVHAPDCAMALNGRHACSCKANTGAVPQ